MSQRLENTKPERLTPGIIRVRTAAFFRLAAFGLALAVLGACFPPLSFAASTAGSFGKTGIGASCDTFVNDLKRVNKYSVSVAATVTQLSIYLKPGSASGSQPLKGLLYADSSGSPGSLIASTGQLTYSNTGAAGWRNLSFASPPSLNPGNYWIGVITGSTARVAGYCYDTVANARAYNTNTYSSGPSNPFGSASLDDRVMSLYATYTTPAPNGTPSAVLSAQPTAVTAGQPTTLSWTSSNAGSCSAAWTGSTAPNGSQAVTPDATTTYRITCSGSGGNTTAQVLVTVTDPSSPSLSPDGGTSDSGTAASDTTASAPPDSSASPQPTAAPSRQAAKSPVEQTLIAIPKGRPTAWQNLVTRYGEPKAVTGAIIAVAAFIGVLGYTVRYLRRLVVSSGRESLPPHDTQSLELAAPLELPPSPFL